jgi:hypothetical protein
VKLLMIAALVAAPAFADCCTYERVTAEASRARHEAQRARTEMMRESWRLRLKAMREAARARVEARRIIRTYRNSYRDRRWFF